MKRTYLGLAGDADGSYACVLEDHPESREPRPLYLELSGAGRPLLQLLDYLGSSETPPILAQAFPVPAELVTAGTDDELLVSLSNLDAVLAHADRLQGRRYQRAHLAAWVAWRSALGERLDITRTPDQTAQRWLQHVGRLWSGY